MELIFITTMLEAIILLIVLAIFVTAVRLFRRKSPQPEYLAKRLLVSGVEAVAIVLATEDAGVFLNHQPLIRVQVQVIPERDRNFVVELRESQSYIERASIRRGSTVRVKYNPVNPKETVLLRDE